MVLGAAAGRTDLAESRRGSRKQTNEGEKTYQFMEKSPFQIQARSYKSLLILEKLKWKKKMHLRLQEAW